MSHTLIFLYIELTFYLLKKNANNLKDKIKNGGFPAFVEPFGDNQELFAIYVGPFQTEDDIVNNMKLIQELSESKKGEISRWKF